MQPIIGITTYRLQNAFGQPYVMLLEAYLNAIVRAGGVPILIPSLLAEHGWQALYGRLDGILLSGGGDIGLEHLPGQAHPRIDEVDPARDAVELNLLHAAVEDGKPFLGICRGCQVVNVGLGGTLHTHIPDQVPNALDHSYPGNMRSVLVHEVKIEEGTRTAEVLGDPIVRVNSHHHQGLNEIASRLRVAGRSPDGLVEAVELPDHPFGLAVQWHPEWLTDQQAARNLFSRFVEASSKK